MKKLNSLEDEVHTLQIAMLATPYISDTSSNRKDIGFSTTKRIKTLYKKLFVSGLILIKSTYPAGDDVKVINREI